MATTYRDADAPREIAERLIPEKYPHLKHARIVWLATTNGTSDVKLCGSLLQHAFGKDSSGVYPAFVVVITDTDWLARKGRAREALVATQLARMDRQSNADTGKDRWAKKKPDASVFLSVVKEYGLSTTEEKQLGKLIKDLPEQLALAMDSDDEDEDDSVIGDDEPDHSDWPEAPAPPAHFGSSANSESADTTKDRDWDDATRPDVSPEALSRIRGSVVAAER